jgi:hypothetical protein
MNKPALMAITSLVAVSACDRLDPASVCSAPDVKKDVIAMLVGNIDSRFREREVEIAEKIFGRVTFTEVAFEGQDDQTGQISCSATVSSDESLRRERVFYSRQKEAGGDGHLYTVQVPYQSLGNGAQVSDTLLDPWLREYAEAALASDGVAAANGPSSSRSDLVDSTPSSAQSAGPSHATDFVDAGRSDEAAIHEWNGIKVFNSYSHGLSCEGCDGAPERRPLSLGPSRVEGSHQHYLLLTPDTGNLPGGGTTYALNLKTAAITDLHTLSESYPTFRFVERGDGVYVVATQDGQAREFLLDVKR